MKIPINHELLNDSPYDGKTKSVFDLTSLDIDDFKQDLKNGNPTCYLISGYRGAGKSSFIKQLEIDSFESDNRTVFIYLNFAKYEERSIVLRKLIRSFYLKADKSQLFKNIRNGEDQEKLNKIALVKDLYERTFYEVSKNTNEKSNKKKLRTKLFKANLKEILFVIGTLLLTTSIFTGFEFKWYSWLISAVPIFGLAKFFQYENKHSNEEVKSEEVSKSMLYDDEIAEHYFLELLKSFKDDLKPVFVLDELDKIKDDELSENLINELKPIMLSGYCSFIVVAGQNLYYNYYFSQNKDDSILSSLFSKVHHVPILSSSELRNLFSKLTKPNDESLNKEHKDLLNCFIDYLIFKSKRVPRKFIILIRQNLTWEENRAYLHIDKSLKELTTYSKVINIIERIESEVISSDISELAIQDFFRTQLILQIEYILNLGEDHFTEQDLIENYG